MVIIMRNKSLFFKFFTGLTLLIAVPMIIITTILSYEVMQYSENEISKIYIGKLKTAGSITEVVAQDIYMDALKLSMDGDMDGMSNMSLDKLFSDSDEMMKAYSLHDTITNLSSANEMLQSVYLYPDGADYLLTSTQGIVEKDKFIDKSWIDDYNKFKEYQPGNFYIHNRTIRNSDLNEQGAEYKVITLFYSFTPYTTGVKGTLIFNVYEKKLRDMINSHSSMDEGYIMIINKDGDVISDVDEKLVGTRLKEDYIAKICDSSSSEGYLVNSKGNEQQLVTYFKSDFNNWIYIGTFPMTVLTSKVNSLIIRTIYISMAFLALGILAAYIFSKKMSSPLDKLVEDIRIKRGVDIKSNDSEMAIISKAFERMIHEEDRLFSLLESTKNNNRNAYLMNLLQGKFSKDMDREFTGIDFSFEYFTCVVIYIDKYGEFTKAYSSEQQEYMKAFILDVSEQLISREYNCAGLLYQRKGIAIIVNHVKESDIDVDLKNIFKKIQDELSKVLDNTISIGIGNTCKNQSCVVDSFDHALEALKYKLITGYGSINLWKNVENGESVYFYPYTREKQLFNMINSGITEKIDDTVKELVGEVRLQESINYENIVQIFTQLAVNTVKLLLDQNLNIGMIFGNSYNIYHILSGKETIDDIEEWLIEMFTRIAEYMSGARGMSKGYFDRVLEYIHDNYRKDIDINAIAENVGLSYSYLRKIFKDETGDNIINYINHIRVEESKRLLLQTGMTVKEIALNLGYNNEQSFLRFFKKYEECSPGEYRISRKSAARENGTADDTADTAAK
jgi:AraC-like DNA-binding protein